MEGGGIKVKKEIGAERKKWLGGGGGGAERGRSLTLSLTLLADTGTLPKSLLCGVLNAGA